MICIFRLFPILSRLMVIVAIAILALLTQPANAEPPPPATRTRWMEVPGDGKPRAPRSEERSQEENWSNGFVNYRGAGGQASTDLMILNNSSYFTEAESNAFPVNYGFLETPLPGDFLPIGTTFASHTLALVPNRLANKSTTWNGLARATLHDSVDLVTGVPLVQFSDLSLPFNGAQFRLLRTRSSTRQITEKPQNSTSEGFLGFPGALPDDRFWDWVGSGWMMSENPLLIIDSTMADDVGKRGQPRCYLWLDAFHSIPFDWVKGESGKGFYDCAPRFRAKMTASVLTESGRRYSNEDGGPFRHTLPSEDGAANAGQWNTHPDRFEISLFDGELVYEFTPVWQDVPSWQYEWLERPINDPEDIIWTSLHERPLLPMGTDAPDSIPPEDSLKTAKRGPWGGMPINSSSSGVAGDPKWNGRGLGMPYIGMLTKIRDRFNNRVEIDYAPLTEWNDGGVAGTTDPTHVQTTSQKGLVREVRLKSAENTTHWTLLYGYRMIPRGGRQVIPQSFADSWGTYSDARKMAWSDPALDSIYVFEGAVNTRKVTLLRAPDDSLGSSDNLEALRSNDSNDLLAAYIAGNLPSALEWPGSEDLGISDLTSQNRWRFRCRYHYKLTIDTTRIGIQNKSAAVECPAVLVRAEVDNSPSDELAAPRKRNVAFLYDNNPEPSHTYWLTHVFDDAGIDRAASSLLPSAQTHEQAIQSVLGLQNLGSPASASFVAGKSVRDIHEAAAVWYHSTVTPPIQTYPTGSFGQAPSLGIASDNLLPGQPSKYFADSGRGTVSAFSLLDESGRRRFYRLTRFLAGPDSAGSESQIHDDYDTASIIFSTVHDSYYPMRSIFHSPYWWQAYAQTDCFAWPENALTWDGGSQARKEVDYAGERWVTLVDEFTNWDDFENDRAAPITTGAGTKLSFFPKSTSRQIIGMNPLGNVLWQKNYSLSGGKFSESGDTGLTEHYRYKSGFELLQELSTKHGLTAPTETSVPAGFRTERFLVEKTSAGYAAAEIEAKQNSLTEVEKGLVHVFEYDIVSSDSSKGWGERIKPTVQGIRNGDEGTLQYTNQTLYHPTDPTTILGSVQYTTPPTVLLSQPTTVTPAYEVGSHFIGRSRTDKGFDSAGNYSQLVTRSISARRSLTPDGSAAAYYDVSVDVAGPTGLSVWSISAFASNPDAIDAGTDPNALARFTYNKYNSYGQIEHSWEDIDPTSFSEVSTADRALLPEDANTRMSPDPTPAALHTEYRYDNGELSDIIYPNGRRWAKRICSIDGLSAPDDIVNDHKSFTRVFTFNDLVPDGSTGLHTTSSLCSIKDYAVFEYSNSWFLAEMRPAERSANVYRHVRTSRSQTILIQSRDVWFTSGVNIGVSQNYTNFEEAPKVKLSYDSSGRLTNVKSLDLDWSGENASEAEIQDNGDRIRTKEMDGNSTMQLRNARGQIVRTYSGTNAFDWNDDTYTTPESPADVFDCILTARSEFGTGWTNAMLPSRQWRYLKTPEISEGGWSADNLRPYGPAPASDPEGELTETKYDWRMRPVRVDVSAPVPPGGSARPPLSTRLTYLDHADRPVLEVSYGAGTLSDISAVDPSLFEPESTRLANSSTIATLIGDVLNTNPASVVETRYFDDGSVRERLTYRLHGTGYTSGSSQYHAERYGYGAGGTQIFAQQAGSPTAITTIDNMGRVLSEKSILPRTSGGVTTYDYELTRTEYGYDADGQVIISDRWERIMPGGGWGSGVAPTGDAALSSDNAVRTRTETWYDAAKRVIATAEYGSESGDGTFTTPSGAATLAARLATRLSSGQKTLTPTLSVPGVDGATAYEVDSNGASVGSGLLTVHAYDRAGNRIATATPRTSSTWTYSRSEYDAKGKLFLQTDDVTGLARQTTYSYWLGRTVNISSARLEDPAASANQTWQTQGVAYGAEVVAEGLNGATKTLKYISRNNSLVGAMMSASADKTPGTGKLREDDPAAVLNERRPDVIAGIRDFNYGSLFAVAATSTTPAVPIFQPDFVYRYYADGLLAERVDRRKLAMRYFYDEQRRLKEVEVWHYVEGDAPVGGGGDPTPVSVAKNIYKLEDAQPGYPSSMTGPTGVPADRVGFVAYEYDNKGNVTRVSAKTGRSATGFVADTTYTYDERNNLTKEYQSHGVAATTSSPSMTYARGYSSGTSTTSGRDRLTSMTYPAQSGLSAGRVLNFGYGAANSPDDITGRIGSMTMGSTHVASFGYTGSGRRAALKMGGSAALPKITQTFDLETATGYVGLEGLDAFGRVKDLHYINTASSDSTLWQGEYGYDVAGNRKFERLTQRPHSSSGAGANTRSRFFGFDQLDRLLTVESGALNSGNSSVGVSDAYASVRTEGWNFDKLGNWVEAGLQDPKTGTGGDPDFDDFEDPCAEPPGPVTPTLPWVPGDEIPIPSPGGGGSTASPHGHFVSQGGTVTGRSHTIRDKSVPNGIAREMLSDGSGTPAWNTCIYDPCGNLAFDGDYYFQYDAWGRLIEVRDSGNLRWQHFTAGGVPLAKDCPEGFEAGPLVKHFTYDGVGRVIRTSSPMTAPDGYQFTYLDANNVEQTADSATRSERFYYDGVRRVQDIVTEPVLKNGEGDTVTLSDEVYQANTSMSTGPYVRAQYVWGPGDNGVDELLCQLDPRDTSQTSYSNGGGKPWYVLTDAQGDVVSMTHVPPGSNQVAEVGGQWTYSPYGEVLTYEKLHPHPVMVFGHKTLAVDRLDIQAISWDFEEGSISENQRLMPGARLAAYARNRTLDVSRGRWLQSDPNQSGLGVSSAENYHGAPTISPNIAINLNAHVGDGLNLFGGLGANPIAHNDPSGLFFGGLVGAFAPMSTMDMYMDHTQNVLENGMTARSVFGQVADDYNTNLELDISWASDWSASDNAHSRSGTLAYVDMQLADPEGPAADDFAMGGAASGTRRGLSTAAKVAAKYEREIFTSYTEALKISRGLAGKVNAHHLVESRLLRGKVASTAATPAVVLTRAQHQQITNLLRKAIPYGTDYRSIKKAKVIEEYKKAYKSFSHPNAQAMLNSAISYINSTLK